MKRWFLQNAWHSELAVPLLEALKAICYLLKIGAESSARSRLPASLEHGLTSFPTEIFFWAEDRNIKATPVVHIIDPKDEPIGLPLFYIHLYPFLESINMFESSKSYGFAGYSSRVDHTQNNLHAIFVKWSGVGQEGSIKRDFAKSHLITATRILSSQKASLLFERTAVHLGALIG